MARKKHLNGIDREDMELINQKMSKKYELVDDYKTHLKSLSYKLDIKCKNEKQKDFLNHLKDTTKKLNICNAPAGVGKSYLALSAALYQLKLGIVSKIIVLVPTVEASEACKIGLLPGSIDEKIDPWRRVTINTLEKILNASENYNSKAIVGNLINSGLITFELLSYVRGANFDDSFVILDESENLSKKECLLLLSRLGDKNSKIALIGDEQQCDRKDLKTIDLCGLKYAEMKLQGLEEVTVDHFTNEDIVRNPFLTKLLNAWYE